MICQPFRYAVCAQGVRGQRGQQEPHERTQVGRCRAQTGTHALFYLKNLNMPYAFFISFKLLKIMMPNSHSRDSVENKFGHKSHLNTFVYSEIIVCRSRFPQLLAC